MTHIGSGKRSYDGQCECSRSRFTKAGFLCLTKIINLRLRVDDLYCICQNLYHNLAIVGPAGVDLYWFFFVICLIMAASAARRCVKSSLTKICSVLPFV